MANVRRPKLKRYPKRPKSSANLGAWKRYNENCTNTERENGKRITDFNKLVREKASAKKTKENIIKRTKGMKGIALSKKR
jgi:hypothetical protein